MKAAIHIVGKEQTTLKIVPSFLDMPRSHMHTYAFAFRLVLLFCAGSSVAASGGEPSPFDMPARVRCVELPVWRSRSEPAQTCLLGPFPHVRAVPTLSPV